MRRTPATSGITRLSSPSNASRAGRPRCGMPVATTASSSFRRPETRRRLSLRNAPTPFSAQYSSLLIGLKTMPAKSEEHTSELQSLMRISYAVFCLKKKKHKKPHDDKQSTQNQLNKYNK